MAETSVSLLQLARYSPDSTAWLRLTEIYSPLLQASLMRYDLQAADAEDLIQEVGNTEAQRTQSCARLNSL
jgi:hypothetical protein